jgi:hypothetical protein
LSGNGNAELAAVMVGIVDPDAAVVELYQGLGDREAET